MTKHPNKENEKYSYKSDIIIAACIIAGLFGGLITVILWAKYATGLL